MALEILGPLESGQQELLTPQLAAFLEALHRHFEPQRRRLLQDRRDRQRKWDRGLLPDFRADTESIRTGSWQVDPAPSDLLDRRVEITGPTDAKMVINALNSGARVFMADFEDALSPAWKNVVQGQLNLSAAIDGTLAHVSEAGKVYQIGPKRAVLVVRPRGWHLDEVHVQVDGEPISGALFDFGVYLWRNHQRLSDHGTGPYYYLPKLECFEEAQLWNTVFDFAEGLIGLAPGTIKATVLIETITAAFEMEEILYVLRHHVVGLNAGRWDYLFSIIKTFREQPGAILPDRSQITMQVPFMRAYCELLVQTCHRRGAHAIGGMAAFIPSRRDAEVNRVALAKVAEDKEREAGQGFDGTWVAHPDLVAVARAAFDAQLQDAPHQKHCSPKAAVSAQQLLDFTVPGGSATRAGVVNNLTVAVQYLAAWLNGQGAVALFNLMEDAATAEISRSQLFQWLHHRVPLEDGQPLTLVQLNALLDGIVSDLPPTATLSAAVDLVRRSCIEQPMWEFTTTEAYRVLTVNAHAAVYMEED